MSKKRKRPGGGKTAKAQKVDKPKNLPAETEPRQQQKPWQEHVKGIVAAWQKSVAAIIETGRLLIEAKADIPLGGWETVVKTKLPFAETVAQRLMRIAANPVLCHPGHAPVLPARYETLYALTLVDKKLGEGALLARIQDGSINPKTQRKDVTSLWREPKPQHDHSRSTTARSKYIAFLRQRTPQQQREDLEMFRTAIGALGVSIQIDVKEPPTIDGTLADTSKEKSDA